MDSVYHIYNHIYIIIIYTYTVLLHFHICARVTIIIREEVKKLTGVGVMGGVVGGREGQK